MVRNEFDVIVAGGGIVGAALAYGLRGGGKRVLVLDGSDGDARAAKANFGLVGALGKGFGAPAYQRLSRESVALWPEFAAQLFDETGIDVEYENRGCLRYCVSDAEFLQHSERLGRWNAQVPDEPAWARMIDRAELERLLPGARLGSTVCGAAIGDSDGHVNPLKLLRAVLQAFISKGGRVIGNSPVSSIRPRDHGGFNVVAKGGSFDCEQVIVAAGLGATPLAEMVGLEMPVRPQRGQVLVTERLDPVLHLPASAIRQTRDGTVMIGVSQEEVGMNLDTTTAVAARMTKRAVSILPDLAKVNLVRHWACLRVLTPDGLPIYAQSTTCPGAWAATCHSGVTLAAMHAGPVARAIASSTVQLPSNLQPFHSRRFNVSKAI